jgi:GT2 family glycosyltransferase
VPRFVAPSAASPVEPGAVPSFSVIIAAYQAAGTIADAVRSARDQQPPPLEVVVCDDGSTDDLTGALAPFATDASVRVLRQDNAGEAAAKTAAARAASGDFVVILDADDIFLPGRLCALGALASARPDLDILTTDAFLEADGKRIGGAYGPNHAFASDDQRLAILDRNFIFGLAAIRRERLLAAGGFDTTISHATDWDCWVRLVLDGARVGLVDEPLAVYRLHRGAANASRVAMAEGRLRVLQKAAAHPSLDARERAFVRDRIAAEAARVNWERLRDALTSGQPARQLGIAVARDTHQPRGRRARGLLAAIAPSVARRRLRSNAERTWTTVGDMRLPV